MEIIDLSHTEVVEIGRDAFAECVALADISFPPTMPTFGDGVFNDCTALKDILETIRSFGDLASFPFHYLARCPVSTLDDLKRSPPAGSAPFPLTNTGDTPLHCACQNFNTANSPSIIEHVRLRASELKEEFAQFENRSWANGEIPPPPSAPFALLPYPYADDEIRALPRAPPLTLLLRSFLSRRSSVWIRPPCPPITSAATSHSTPPFATRALALLPFASSPMPTPPR